MTRMTPLRWICIAALLALAPPGAAGEVTLDLSRSTISQDETASLTLTIKGGLKQAPPEIPLPDGLVVRGTSQRHMTVNAKTESRVVYEIGAEKPGEYEIGPFTLNTEDGSYTLAKRVLTVTAPKVTSAREDLFFTLDTSADTAYVSQALEVTLSVYSVHQVEDLELLDFAGEGFELGEWQQVRARNRALQGTTYRVRRYVNRLTPVRAGEYSLDPTFRVRVAVPKDLRRDDGFPMFRRRHELRTSRLKLDTPVSLTIKAPPDEGRPDSFSGHIGAYDLRASVSPREVEAGDPLTLRVSLSGKGGIKEALPPELEGGKDFKVYDSRLVQEDLQRGGVSGRKVLEQVLIPLRADVTEVPALEFSYFDPERESYRTATVGPFPITVTGDAEAADGPGHVSSIREGTPSTAPTLVGEDLLYLKTRSGILAPLSARAPGVGFAARAALPFVLYALVWGGAAFRARGENDPAGGRRRRAPRQLRRGLDHLSTLQTPSERAAAMWTLLSDYLRDRLDLPAGDIDPDTVAATLRDRVDGDTLDELTRWLRDCERARFGGPAPDAVTENACRSFREFMQRLDREIRA